MKLDMYVWEEACRFLREQMDKGNDIVPISVNISRIDLYNPELCSFIKGLVEKYDIPRSKLELEFTESAFMDNPQLLIQTMSALRDYGFTVEIDDFGKGYSSLSMLKDIRADVLKIDMSLLNEIESNPRSSIILGSVINMAGLLGMDVITEGIETMQQLETLISLGCRHFQGFYFSPPVPVAEFEKQCRKAF
jgi:EAL domain-containing protein (putative c-di-GMP-specific phosphodiesterase class I)